VKRQYRIEKREDLYRVVTYWRIFGIVFTSYDDHAVDGGSFRPTTFKTLDHAKKALKLKMRKYHDPEWVIILDTAKAKL